MNRDEQDLIARLEGKIHHLITTHRPKCWVKSGPFGLGIWVYGMGLPPSICCEISGFSVTAYFAEKHERCSQSGFPHYASYFWERIIGNGINITTAPSSHDFDPHGLYAVMWELIRGEAEARLAKSTRAEKSKRDASYDRIREWLK